MFSNGDTNKKPLISNIYINNFKAFGKMQDIIIRPLTLIFGPNSSGKSSIIHSIIFLNEILEYRNVNTVDVKETVLGGDMLDLGGFRQTIFKRNSENSINLALAVDIGELHVSHDLFDFDAECFGWYVKVGFKISLYKTGLNDIPEIDLQTMCYRLDVAWKQIEEACTQLGIVAPDGNVYPHLVLTPGDQIAVRKVIDGVKGKKGKERKGLSVRKFKKKRSENESAQTDEDEERQNTPIPLVTAFRIESLQAGTLLDLRLIRGNGEYSVMAIHDINTEFAIIWSIYNVLCDQMGDEKINELFLSRLLKEVIVGMEVETRRGIPRRVSRRADREFGRRVDRVLEEVFGPANLTADVRVFDERSIYRDVILKHVPLVLDQVFDQLSESLRNVTRKMSYIGPIRSYPGRFMLGSGGSDARNRFSGDKEWALVMTDRMIRDKVNRFLGADFMDTPYSLQPRTMHSSEDIRSAILKLSGTMASFGKWAQTMLTPLGSLSGVRDVLSRIEYEMEAKGVEPLRMPVLLDKRTNTLVSHRDVGVGISQVLPVLVAAVGSVESLLCVEQPELHLHPRLQSELADVFIEGAVARENIFMIETHSEHLLLRVMKRMRQTSEGNLPEGAHPVSPKDVAVLYVEPGEEGSVVYELPLNERGELMKAWPGGFFEEGLREMF